MQAFPLIGLLDVCQVLPEGSGLLLLPPISPYSYFHPKVIVTFSDLVSEVRGVMKLGVEQHICMK